MKFTINDSLHRIDIMISPGANNNDPIYLFDISDEGFGHMFGIITEFPSIEYDSFYKIISYSRINKKGRNSCACSPFASITMNNCNIRIVLVEKLKHVIANFKQHQKRW
jgi:hypothetical protein